MVLMARVDPGGPTLKPRPQTGLFLPPQRQKCESSAFRHGRSRVRAGHPSRSDTRERQALETSLGGYDGLPFTLGCRNSGLPQGLSWRWKSHATAATA